MPRGRTVSHKGRSRHFTNPEDLQNDEKLEAAGSDSGNEKIDPENQESDSSDDDNGAKKGVSSLIEIENPNWTVKKASQKVQELEIQNKPVGTELSRREREQIEKQKAKLRYEKLHAAGKTSEAKADLARLALIRQQRVEAAAKREAEKKSAEEKKTKKV